MSWLPLRAEAIPAELRALPAVLWRAEQRGEGKPSKVPYRVAYPSRRASSTDPATWGRFEDAVDVAGCPELHVDGLGVVLTQAAGIVCIDLDRVVSPDGAVDERAATIVERCGSWAETSPSGRGLHIFVLGTVPRALKGEQIEVYADARYIAVTGHQWPRTPDVLQSRQLYLDHLVRLAEEGERPRRPWTGPRTPAPDDLAGALVNRLEGWGVPVARLKRWGNGFLVELDSCPWADEHTTGSGGAAVMIRASGAFNFTCLHAHCGGRGWRDFRTAMEGRS